MMITPSYQKCLGMLDSYKILYLQYSNILVGHI